jgi:hypothetical protein
MTAGTLPPVTARGVYTGLAVSNRSSGGQSRTNGGPDTSDRDHVTGNHVYSTTAENVDIMDASNGVIANKRFDWTGMSAMSGMSGANYADSWVDIAGNGYLVSANNGINPGDALLDGYRPTCRSPAVPEQHRRGQQFRGQRSGVRLQHPDLRRSARQRGQGGQHPDRSREGPGEYRLHPLAGPRPRLGPSTRVRRPSRCLRIQEGLGYAGIVGGGGGSPGSDDAASDGSPPTACSARSLTPALPS